MTSSIGKWSAAALPLLAAALIAAGCSGGQSAGGKAESAANSANISDAGGAPNGQTTPSQPDSPPADSGNAAGSAGQGGGKNASEGSGDGSGAPKAVAENDAFRVFAPAPDSAVSGKFVVTGEALVFEAAFSYKLEAGGDVIAEGHSMADKGAPEWGAFSFTVQLGTTNADSGVLTIYEASAKDGSPTHELHIPLKFSGS